MESKIEVRDTALLVIDVVNMCCHPKYEVPGHEITFEKIRKMVPRLEEFITQYRKSKGNVIFVNCVPWTKEYLAKNIEELYKDPKCSYHTTDSTGFAEKFFGLKPEIGDTVITKNTYDAFTNPALSDYLKNHKIKHVVVTGIFGDGCVLSTIQGGFSAGYNFIILKDLIETTDDKVRQKLQGLLKEYTWPVMFGKTIDSGEFWDVVRV